MDRSKKIYIVGFLLSISVIPLILAELIAVSIQSEPSDAQAFLLMLLLKSGMITITVWYGLKVGMKKVWAGLLGLSAALPLVWWVSVAYLLTKKTN